MTSCKATISGLRAWHALGAKGQPCTPTIVISTAERWWVRPMQRKWTITSSSSFLNFLSSTIYANRASRSSMVTGAGAVVKVTPSMRRRFVPSWDAVSLWAMPPTDTGGGRFFSGVEGTVLFRSDSPSSTAFCDCIAHPHGRVVNWIPSEKNTSFYV